MGTLISVAFGAVIGWRYLGLIHYSWWTIILVGSALVIAATVIETSLNKE